MKQALYLPISREGKYKAKAAIYTFFMRFEDVFQAGIVKLVAELSFSNPTFAWLKVTFTILWLGIASRLSAERRAIAKIQSRSMPPFSVPVES